MATAAEAIERIAEAAGILPATVSRAARALREADVHLWPQGTQGRGQGAQVEPHHLVNLLIAVATGFPAEAVANVRRYRALTAEDGTEFGQHLDNLIDAFAGDLDGSKRAVLGKDKFFVKMVLGEINTSIVFDLMFSPPDDLVEKHHEKPNFETLLVFHAAISLELLNVLADLWRDTLTYRAIRAVHAKGGTPATLSNSQPGAAATAHPENETAATPAREAAAVDQDQTSIPGRDTPEPMQEREPLQGQSRRGAGHSHQLTRKAPDDETSPPHSPIP